MGHQSESNTDYLLCYTASFIGLTWETYEPPQAWSHGDGLLRHILGTVRRLSAMLKSVSYPVVDAHCFTCLDSETVVRSPWCLWYVTAQY